MWKTLPCRGDASGRRKKLEFPICFLPYIIYRGILPYSSEEESRSSRERRLEKGFGKVLVCGGFRRENVRLSRRNGRTSGRGFRFCRFKSFLIPERTGMGCFPKVLNTIFRRRNAVEIRRKDAVFGRLIQKFSEFPCGKRGLSVGENRACSKSFPKGHKPGEPHLSPEKHRVSEGNRGKTRDFGSVFHTEIHSLLKTKLVNIGFPQPVENGVEKAYSFPRALWKTFWSGKENFCCGGKSRERFRFGGGGLPGTPCSLSA